MKIFELLKQNFHFILIFIGLILFSYSLVAKDELNKNTRKIYKIIGIAITIIGCIIYYLKWKKYVTFYFSIEFSTNEKIILYKDFLAPITTGAILLFKFRIWADDNFMNMVKL